MLKNAQLIGLLLAIVLIVGAIVYLDQGRVGPGNITVPIVDVALPATSTEAAPPVSMTTADRIAAKEKLYERAKELVAPSGFVNTSMGPHGENLPITLSQYVGKKVILLDIMTYSCINCIRTFPYLVDWYTKYEDKGLIIIGIHTPEFDFEKNIDNVRAAMAKYGIKFPVVLDNDYGTWTAYNNQYWPHKYLIDIDGFVRYDHIGEGGYDETEGQIQELLQERADVLGFGTSTKAAIDMPVSPDSAGAPVTPGQTPETYLGSARSGDMPGVVLSDGWDVQSDAITSTKSGATISYDIAAKNVYLVASAATPVKVDVTIDGASAGSFTVNEARLYDVYRGSAFGSHALKLTVEGAGLKAFTFTFGN